MRQGLLTVESKTRRMAGLLVVMLGVALCLSACGSARRTPLEDGDSSYRASEFRAQHEPYGKLLVTRLRDRRPSYELGSVNYLNESWYSESLLRGSVGSNLRRVALAELEQSGVFITTEDATLATHELELTIFHFYAKADRDLLGLIPVVPSVDLEAHIDFHALLRDVDGRRFVDRRFEGTKTSNTATVAGVESTAGELLLELLSELMDEFVRESDRGVADFWAQFGRKPPRR